jgi:hypothetical protein
MLKKIQKKMNMVNLKNSNFYLPYVIIENIMLYSITTNKLTGLFMIRKIKVLSKKWREWVNKKDFRINDSLHNIMCKYKQGINISFDKMGYKFRDNNNLLCKFSNLQYHTIIDILLPENECSTMIGRKRTKQIRNNSTKLKKSMDKLSFMKGIKYTNLSTDNLISLSKGNFWKKIESLCLHNSHLNQERVFSKDNIFIRESGINILFRLFIKMKNLKNFHYNHRSPKTLKHLLKNLPNSLKSINISGFRISNKLKEDYLKQIYCILKMGRLPNLYYIKFYSNILSTTIIKYDEMHCIICIKIVKILQLRQFRNKLIFRNWKINISHNKNYAKVLNLCKYLIIYYTSIVFVVILLNFYISL